MTRFQCLLYEMFSLLADASKAVGRRTRLNMLSRVETLLQLTREAIRDGTADEGGSLRSIRQLKKEITPHV